MGELVVSSPITAEVWTDYICPWAYLGTDRTSLIESLGVPVAVRGYELHPELSAAPATVRPGGKLSTTFDTVAELARECGVEFVAPAFSSSTRLALECHEVARYRWPDRAEAFHRSLWAARWIDGTDLADRQVIALLASRADLPLDDLWPDIAAGVGNQLLARSIDDARSAGIVATPAWRFNTGFILTGIHDRSTITRWITRMVDRAALDAEPAAGHIT